FLCLRRRISARHRAAVRRRDERQAVHQRGRAARRRPSLVRAAVLARAQPDESGPRTGKTSVNELFDLSGRTAIVTGTSRGLGQYFARALARAGADLVLTSRNCEHLRSFAAEIEALGRRTVSVELDVRKHESIEHMVAAAENAFGHLDILVNNAGCNIRKPALDVTWEDWNTILETN